MGVQGLTALLHSHPSIHRDVRFRGSRLVIDGNNLMFLLYFGSGEKSCEVSTDVTFYSKRLTLKNRFCGRFILSALITLITTLL